MKSDVKAVRVTATGAVFAGRTRLRGLILASDGGGAGTIVLQDNTDSTTLFQGDCPNGDVFAFNIPEDGVVFPVSYTHLRAPRDLSTSRMPSSA